MKKKLLVLLSLLSVMVIGAGTTACGGNNQTSGTNSESTSDSIPAVPTLTLSASSLNLDLYASAILTATLENSEETLVWESSDETVAKVVDGVVTAYKTGSATITVTAGDLTQSCAVTVGEMGTFAFSGLETEIRLMKGSSMPLDLTLSYNDSDFTMAEISVEVEGDEISYADETLTAEEYGTQNVVVTAKVNGTVVHTHTIAVTVFESGSIDVELDGEDIGLKIGGEGFALSNFKAIVNGVSLESPDFTVTFGEDGIAKNEDGLLYPVAEGTTTVTVQFTTTQGTYDKIVTVRVYKEVFALGEFLVKGDAGKDAANIGVVTMDFSGKGVALQDVEKITLDGVEVTDAAIDGDTLSLTNPAGGAHAIVLETAVARYNATACFYGHSISTVAELEEWRTGNILAYTVLLNDIDLDGETLPALDSGYKAGVLDGLGHTVYNFMMKKGFVHGIAATGGIKNLQLANFIQDCASVGAGAVGFGVLAVDNGGTIENVMLRGKLVNVPNADHYGLIYKGALENSVCKNVFAELYTDGLGNHYTGPLWTDDSGNYTLSNVAIVFNGAPYHKDYTPAQVVSYNNMEEFAANVDLSLWNGWTLEDGKFFMNAFEDSKYSVYSFGEAVIGSKVIIYGSSFVELTYEATEGKDFITIDGNVITVLETAKSGDTFSVAVKDAEGTVVETFTYTVTLEASLYAKGMSLAGETVEFIISSNLPDEMFIVEILEGGEFGTLDGRMLSINADAEVGSIIKIKVSCTADENWGEEFDFIVSKEVVVEETLFDPTSDFVGSATTEVAAPAGFENVHKYVGTGEYIHGGSYSAKCLNNYSFVTFAIKTPHFCLDVDGWNDSNEWLVFELTQTSEAVWTIEVSINGEVIHTATNMSGNRDGGAYVYNALDAIIYGVPSISYYVGNVNNELTVYFTEVRGITSVVEPEPDPDPNPDPEPEQPKEPVGTIIEETLYDSTGEFVGSATTEVAAPEGFENVHKFVGTGENIHGANYSAKCLSDYSFVTFAIKTPKMLIGNGGWIETEDWLVFELTQTSEAVWTITVLKNGEVLHTAENMSGNRDGGAYVYNALDSILYGVPSPEYYVGSVNNELSAYFTEVRGILK